MSTGFSRRSRRSRSLGRMGYAKATKAMVVRGYTRTGGIYNRFNRPARRPEQKCIDWHVAERAYLSGVVGYPYGVDTAFPTLLDPVHIYNNSTGTAMTSTGHLLQIAQGAGLDQRIGRKIQVKSMEIIGTLYLPAIAMTGAIPALSAFSASETHHMWIVLDTQVNGSNTGQNSQIWQPNPVAGSAPNDTLALRNLANSARFKILKHIVTPLERKNVNITTGASPTYASADGVQKQLNVFLKLDIPIEYSNLYPDGTITTLRDNGLFIFTASQPGVAAWSGDRGTDPAVSVMAQEQYNIRIRYTDV